MNPIYEMFNQQYIQQQAQEKHLMQIAKIQDSVTKLKDFLDSTYEIEPEYRNSASIEFCAVIIDYINKHSN